MTSPGQALRAAIAAPEILVAPGAYDAITARLVERNGFEAIYVTGGGTTNATFGLPDLGFMTMPELAATLRNICAVTEAPVLVDADTGFGTPLNVWRTVRELDRAGVGGLHIEDQDGVKRCGHLAGKAVIPAEEMCGKLTAAVEARGDSDLVIVARTDAAAIEGVEGAIARAHAYAAAGADMIFVEALESREEFARVAAEVGEVPLMANMTEFGKTPLITAAEFEQLGYAMVIFPMTLFRLMLRAVDEGLAELRRSGTQRELIEKMRTRAELYEIVEHDRHAEDGERWSGDRAGRR
jgi:methylisocitrate lyase